VRGAVYRLRPPKDLVGHEQAGPRFAVVVQATRLEHWSTWIVVPTSSSPNAQRGLLRPVIDFGHGECVAMIDAVRSIDPQRRLGEEVGYVSLADMMAIEKALAFVLDTP
jgi:mRNA interferase MazF